MLRRWRPRPVQGSPRRAADWSKLAAAADSSVRRRRRLEALWRGLLGIAIAAAVSIVSHAQTPSRQQAEALEEPQTSPPRTSGRSTSPSPDGSASSAHEPSSRTGEQGRETPPKVEKPTRSYTDADLDQVERPKEAGEERPSFLNSTRVWLHYPYPAGTTKAEARRRFAASEKEGVGRTSAHCNCPSLEPFGKVVSTVFLGPEEFRELGAQVSPEARVSFGAEVELTCTCPAQEPALEDDAPHNYRTYKNGLARLKKECVAGRALYCRAFDDRLGSFEKACTGRFSTVEECRGHLAALRGLAPGAAVALAKNTVAKRLTYNMPCSKAHLPTCRQCVQFQMELSDSVEYVGREKCKAHGLSVLASFRNLSCRDAPGGPNPLYEASCAP